ncbi:MAG: SURF1 family protein [Gammaproteobacteria bacterium]
MSTVKRQFRPGLWPSIAVALLLPLLIGLGFWQLDRAGQKEALEEAYRSRQAAPPMDLMAAGESGFEREKMLWRRVLLRGEYLPDKQFLLDNQAQGGKPGYLIFSPFRLAGRETVVLVNRGWLPMTGGRDAVPDVPPPADNGAVRGTAKDPQSTGLALAGSVAEDLGRGLVRVQQLDLEALARSNNWSLLPYVVRLEQQTGSGFVRDWREPGFGREKHLGYAFQWFAMAAALLIIYLVVNMKPKPDHE